MGVGNSDQPDDPSLWTVDRYRNEVEQVRAGLGLDASYITYINQLRRQLPEEDQRTLEKYEATGEYEALPY